MFPLKRSLAVVGILSAALVASACSGAGGSASSGEDHNDQDVTFTQSMLPHHAQAVEMSDLILAKEGIDPAVTDLASQIKDAQAPEIDLMSGWLDDWGVEAADMGSMDDMDGMMSDEMMSALETSTGDDASRMFLEQMTEHHDGAIDMAETEIEDGQFPDAVDLAESIMETQEAEIAEMDEILATLQQPEEEEEQQ